MVIAVVSICDRTSCIQELRDDLPLTCEKFNAKKPSNSYIYNAGEEKMSFKQNRRAWNNCGNTQSHANGLKKWWGGGCATVLKLAQLEEKQVSHNKHTIFNWAFTC